MAKRAARRFPHPYGVVFKRVVAPPQAGRRGFDLLSHDEESGLAEGDTWFSVLSWGDHVRLCVLPESPTWTRVEVEISRNVLGNLASRTSEIDAIFDHLDAVLPGGEYVVPLSDPPPAALGDEVPDPNARWQLDSVGDHELRYWDGRRFTEHVADAGVRSIDPLPG
jgi:hypothetical protein